MNRPTRIAWILLIGCAVGVVILLRNPINSKVLNLAFLLCIVGTWVTLTFLLWQNKIARYVMAAIPVLAAILFLLPANRINDTELRHDYLKRLNQFENTPYVWGGENSRGIDCSGLPRRALRDALFTYGIRHGNGTAIREAAAQWWYDTSAQALSQGYRDTTIGLGITGTIREIDTTPLQPGDLAITTNGIHLIVYAGEGKWIQADPGIGHVATLDGRTADNLWFLSPVTMHRWSVLEIKKRAIF
jgi:hypothetical protein